MRELGHWVEEQDSDEDVAFDDIAALAQDCKFRDCQHRDEPGCAVRGALPPARLASFHKLSDERRAGATRQKLARKLTETRKAKTRKPPPSSKE
jgi:ribosome biogenesis GTPase